MGGGTTIVEATANGRRAIGSDLNELAHFVTRAKTTPLSEQDFAEIRLWLRKVKHTVRHNSTKFRVVDIPVKNLPASSYHFFSVANGLVDEIRYPRRRQFARCALLRVGQWALDSSSMVPEEEALLGELERRVEAMITGLCEFASAAKLSGTYKNKITATRQLLVSSVTDPALARTLRRHNIRPKLVLTSPPYPGVHVLYHRWQVLGRRETPAPYWIAGIQDGHGESYYTMGSRSELGLKNYFSGISAAFKNLRNIVAPDSTVVQLVSFSDAVVQLPHYLRIMRESGFEEATISGIDSRQIRVVPNRKWYNQGRFTNDAGKEVLLVHCPTS